MKTYIVGLLHRGCDFVAPIGFFKTDEDFTFDPVPCDGRELLISDYKEVAEIFENNYGCVNKFGGDGVNTFALPEMDSCDFVIREKDQLLS